MERTELLLGQTTLPQCKVPQRDVITPTLGFTYRVAGEPDAFQLVATARAPPRTRRVSSLLER